MKRLLFSIFILLLIGCEDVIEVTLPSEDPRLVIDAVLRINNINQPKTPVRIKATLSSSFYDTVQPAKLSQVRILNTTKNSFIELSENPEGSGVYENEWETEFLLNGDLELQLSHKGERYLGRTQFVPAVPIDSLRQGMGTLFGEDETEVLINFTDNGERNDFYLFDFNFGEYLVTEDEFYQGQHFEFSYFYDKRLQDQEELTISLLGIDEDFFNYMNQLIQQSGSDTGPFSTPATTVRGNIVNMDKMEQLNSSMPITDGFALGYFAVCQTFSKTIVINK